MPLRTIKKAKEARGWRYDGPVGGAGLKAKGRLPRTSSGDARKRPPIIFQSGGFPHILSLIIDHASRSALAALCLCSKATYAIASRKLHQNLYTTPDKFYRMIKRGRTKASTVPGAQLELRSSLRRRLQRVKTLHILEYAADFGYPGFPPGILNPTRVVLHVQPPLRVKLEITSFLRHLGGPHLYIRMLQHSFLQNIYDFTLRLQSLHRSITQVTVLYPVAYKSNLPAACDFEREWSSEAKKDPRRAVAIVLLPWKLGKTGNEEKLHLGPRWAKHDQTRLLDVDRRTRFVGGEYARTPETRAAIPKYTIVRADGSKDRTSRVSMSTFRQWLGELGRDTVFTLEEEQELWARDRKLLQRLEVEYAV